MKLFKCTHAPGICRAHFLRSEGIRDPAGYLDSRKKAPIWEPFVL